jgi:hypothetical protein
MILTGGNHSTRRKIFLNATSPTTNPTWTDLGSNTVIGGERPATDGLSQLMMEFSLNCILKLNTYRAVNAMFLGYKKQSVGAVFSEVRAKHASITNLWKRKEMDVTARICTAVLDVTAAVCTAKNTECVSEYRLCMGLTFWVPGMGNRAVALLRTVRYIDHV